MDEKVYNMSEKGNIADSLDSKQYGVQTMNTINFHIRSIFSA